MGIVKLAGLACGLWLAFALPAQAGIVKWEHPDGRIGFAADAAAIPPGARIVEGTLDDAPPPAAPAPGSGASAGRGADPKADPDSICALRTETIAALVKESLLEMEWSELDGELQGARACSLRSVDNTAIRFDGACRTTIRNGTETDEDALTRLLLGSLLDCANIPERRRKIYYDEL